MDAVLQISRKVHRMAEEDFSELYKFLFQRPEEALGGNREGRFVPRLSENVQNIDPIFGLVAMSMNLYQEEKEYNTAFKTLIQMARMAAEIVAKNITIEMVEYVLDEKDR